MIVITRSQHPARAKPPTQASKDLCVGTHGPQCLSPQIPVSRAKSGSTLCRIVAQRAFLEAGTRLIHPARSYPSQALTGSQSGLQRAAELAPNSAPGRTHNMGPASRPALPQHAFGRFPSTPKIMDSIQHPRGKHHCPASRSEVGPTPHREAWPGQHSLPTLTPYLCQKRITTTPGGGSRPSASMEIRPHLALPNPHRACPCGHPESLSPWSTPPHLLLACTDSESPR